MLLVPFSAAEVELLNERWKLGWKSGLKINFNT
jgi:hypothetical protein